MGQRSYFLNLTFRTDATHWALHGLKAKETIMHCAPVSGLEDHQCEALTVRPPDTAAHEPGYSSMSSF